ncbi:hypothetical protein D3C75_1287290 [compost metagenome]
MQVTDMEIEIEKGNHDEKSRDDFAGSIRGMWSGGGNYVKHWRNSSSGKCNDEQHLEKC